MVEKRTIAEVVGVIALMLSLGVVVTTDQVQDNFYTCDGIDMYCHKLSAMNDAGIQRNCYYNPDEPKKYKVCSTGWQKVTIEEAYNNPVDETALPIDNGVKTRYKCDSESCVRI